MISQVSAYAELLMILFGLKCTIKKYAQSFLKVLFNKPQITLEDLCEDVQKCKRGYSVINFTFILDFYYYSVLEKATMMTY